jgi:hypothetical protein
MAKQYFMPRTQDAYVKWHDNLKNNVTANTTGATAADVTQVAADNADLHAKMDDAMAKDNASKASHANLNTSIGASKTNARALAGRIKASTGYTTAIGDTLQLEGAEDSVDMTQQKPALDTNPKSGGVVEVDFNKMSGEGVHIYSMRDGEAGFTLLASETHSPYVDNRPLLTAGKPETRSYKAVFFLGKSEIGLQSDVAQATARP